jgi:hypothetical protein
MDPDGKHLWAIIRCASTDPKRFGSECLDSDLDPILEFDLDGNVLKSFGGGMFIWPHGLDVDQEGNVWVTDAVAPKKTPLGTRGHQVVKFSSSGKVLMILGSPGIAGDIPSLTHPAAWPASDRTAWGRNPRFSPDVQNATVHSSAQLRPSSLARQREPPGPEASSRNSRVTGLTESAKSRHGEPRSFHEAPEAQVSRCRDSGRRVADTSPCPSGRAAASAVE